MTLRHILLAGFTVLVLGVAVYLFFEVRAPAATAQASTDRPLPYRADRDPDKADAESELSAPTPATAGSGSARIGTTPFGGRMLKKIATGSGGRIDRPPPDREDVPTPEPGQALTKPGKLDAIMAEANKAYDRSDFDDARAIAQKVLKLEPTNTRMLRILVSSACIEGDTAEAQKSFNLLPPADREAMKTRCSKYQVTFVDPK